MDPFGLARTTQMTRRRTARTSDLASFPFPVELSEEEGGGAEGGEGVSEGGSEGGTGIQGKMFLVLKERLHGSNRGQPS